MPVPRYYRQTAPAVVTRRRGIAAQAQAGLGRQVQQLGAEVRNYAERQRHRSTILAASRKWAVLDNWVLDSVRGFADRRQELAAVGYDDQTGGDLVGYERELRDWPERLSDQFAALAADLSPDARAIFEQRFNTHAAHWSNMAVSVLEGLELEDVTAEILDRAAADRSADARELLDAYRDRYSPADRQRIAAQIEQASQDARIARAQQYLQEVAKQRGWESAGQVLKDPKWQEMFGLDLEAAAQVKSRLTAFVRDELALAENIRQAELEQANDELISDAYEGKLDLTTLWSRVRDQEVDRTVAEQARKIATDGPAEQDDFETFAQAERRLSLVRQGKQTKAEALAWLRRHAAGLTQEERKRKVAEIERAGDPTDPLTAPRVKLLDGLIDWHYEQGDLGKRGSRDAEQLYIQAKQRFAAWAQAHPEATDAEINSEYERILHGEMQPWHLRWSRNLFMRLLLGPLAYDYTLQRGESPQLDATYELRSEGEPATLEEFEETVINMEPGSAEQKAYYDRWVGKWR